MTKLDNPMSFERLGERACPSCVSSTPSKIPYVGFSPVRLQTGIQPQPSSEAMSRAYMRPGVQAPAACGLLRGKPDDAGHVQPFSWTIRSRGPWLASGLCCPAGSSLTMASSEPLGLSRRFMNYSAGLCLRPRPRGSPIYSTCPSPRAASRTPADRTAACGCRFTVRSSLRPLCTGSASAGSHQSVRVWLRNEAAEFALCCGPESRSPFTDKDFYFRAFIP